MEDLYLIMKLSTLYTAVPEYIEFAWVTAPNAAGQSISANTITTLTLNTEVADTANLVSAPTSNQFTLPAGTYYFEAFAPVYGAFGRHSAVMSLYNVNDAAYVTRSCGGTDYGARGDQSIARVDGQFVISASKTFDLRLLCVGANTVLTRNDDALFTNSTAGADQRTTIKLWKLK